MTKIQCILRPERLEDVYQALADLGIRGMIVSEVRGRGRQGGYSDRYRGREYEVRLIPKISLELVVTDDRVAEVAALLRETAYTGEVGDGKIFFSPVQDALRIRTGERGPAAL